MSVNHLSVDVNQAVEQSGMEFRSKNNKMEEMGMGATSIWKLCKAVGLDKTSKMCLYGKDDQGEHTSVTVKSETKLFF